MMTPTEMEEKIRHTNRIARNAYKQLKNEGINASTKKSIALLTIKDIIAETQEKEG